MYTIVVYIALTYKVYRFKIEFEKKIAEKTLKLQQSFDDKVDEIDGVDGKKNVSHGFSSIFVRSNSRN